MKKLSLILAIVMVMVSFGAAVFAADWPQFQKDAQHTGLYDSGAALPTSSFTATSVLTQAQVPPQMPCGIDSCPIYVTTGGTGYVYAFPIDTLYEYYTSGNSLQKKSEVKVVSKGGFQLSTPASDGTSIYVAVNDMVNQTQDKDFTEGFNNWTTGSSAGSPAFTTGTVGDRSCAQIYEDNGGTDGDGYLEQEVTIPSNTSVRLQFSYRQAYTNAAPSSSQIKVEARPSSGGSWTNILTTSSTTYDAWIPVNENITSYFSSPGVYDIRFIWDYQTAAGSTAICYFNDCEIIAQGFGVKKVNGLGTGTLAIDTSFSGGVGAVRGQANTPIVYHENDGKKYLVLGQYYDSTAGSGQYFCLNPSNGNLKWSFTPNPSSSFYWAGAVCIGGVTIFGDEDGYVHVLDLDTGTELQAYDLSTSDDDPIRSSISYYSTGGAHYLYLSSSDGRLHQLTYDPVNKLITARNSVRPNNVNGSTSTPVRYGDWVYYGCGRLTGANNPGVYAVKVVSGVLSTNPNFQKKISGSTLGIVQASPVVYPSGSDVYVYATENVANGKLACIKFTPGTMAYSTMWTTPSQQYVLQGCAAADGGLFYGDDAGYLYYVH